MKLSDDQILEIQTRARLNRGSWHDVKALLDERTERINDLQDLLHEIQRHQPDGSPAPGGPVELTRWIFDELETRLRRISEFDLQVVDKCWICGSDEYGNDGGLATHRIHWMIDKDTLCPIQEIRMGWK